MTNGYATALTKAEIVALGVDALFGSDAEIQAEITQAYYVWDDAPFPYWEKEKQMKVLANLAMRLGFEIGL